MQQRVDLWDTLKGHEEEYQKIQPLSVAVEG